MGHKNTKKHKATHGNYFEKPSKKEVKANIDFWAALSGSNIVTVTAASGKGIPRLGIQLKLNF